METPADTASPTPLRPRRGRVLLVATSVVAILALATVYTLWDMWNWTPFKYAQACRHPLSGLRESWSPTPRQMAVDGVGVLRWPYWDVAGYLSPPTEPIPVQRCGPGVWVLARDEGDVAMQAYYDRSGQLLALWQYGGGRTDTDCHGATDWYGPLVWCRVAP